MKNKDRINLYKKSQQSINSTRSPHDIVKFLMENLLNSMKNVLVYSGNIEKDDLKDIPKKELAIVKSKNASKALTIIYSLQVSLDFDKTPEIAKNLFQIYEYCRVQIIQALLKKTISGLSKAINALEDILDGWREIKPESL
tara:strand:- start:354 stop:776 length:423 start_codon:yes stop_codon:yes gene_type:complete